MFLKLGSGLDTYTFRMGPFLDSGDGVTPETSLTIAASSILISKAGGAYAAKNETTAATGTGTANGHYTCVLNATDLNTAGDLEVFCSIAGALPVWHRFHVVPAVVYEALFSASNPVDIAAIKAKTDYLPDASPLDEAGLINAMFAASSNVYDDAAAGSVVKSIRDNIALTATGIDAILDEQIGDGTISMRQALRVLVAALAGKLSGAAGSTITIRNYADNTDVIVATVDANGNRTATTLTV